MPAKPDEIAPLPKCECGNDIPIPVLNCVVCGASVGYPNVRYAGRSEERGALDRRLADARISAAARGSTDRLEAFGQAVAESKVVVSRSQGDLDNMLKSDGMLMQAFHPAVRASLRMPQNNEFDPARELNDSRINPYFYDKLHFGALSLDGVGVPHYGPFAITFRNAMVANRTTVFEENPVKFNEAYPPGRKRPVPYGYRAIWTERNKLAMAKLQPKIDPATQDAAFPDILLEKTDNSDGYTDFIEVHIYGDVHPLAFERVLAQVPEDAVDRLIWNRMKDKLATFGIDVEEVAP
jgi:hypothetical protein